MNPDDDQWVSSDAVRTRFREIIDGAAYGGQHIYVRRYGKPAAVIVPVEWHESHRDVTDPGKPVPPGDQSGRFMQPPASLAQARARVLHQMDFLEQSCHIGLDVRWAKEYLDEAVDDYIEFTLTGAVDVERNAAEVKKIAGECAELQAEIVVLEAMREIQDGEE